MNKIFQIIILIVLFLSFAFSSYSFEYSKSKNEIDYAIDYLYNYNLDSSLYYIDIAYKNDPEHPLIPFLKSSVLWLKVQTEQGFKKSLFIAPQ